MKKKFTMDYKLSDLIELSQLEKLLEGFYKTFKISLGLIDSDDNTLIFLGWQDICNKFHRAHHESERKCEEYDKEEKIILGGGEAVVQECVHGMANIAYPIVFRDKTLGSLHVGQFLFEKPDENSFRQRAGSYGYDTDKYLAALQNVEIISSDRALQLTNFLMNTIGMLLRQGYENLKQTNVITELKHSADYLDSIIDQIPLGMQIFDTEGFPVKSNRKQDELMAGLDAGRDMDGFNILNESIGGAEDNPGFYGQVYYNHKMKTREIEYHSRIDDPDSSQKKVFYEFAVPVKDKSGKLISVISLIEEITGLRNCFYALESSEHKYRSVVHSINEGVVIQNSDGIITDFNEAATKILGIDEKKIIGKTSSGHDWGAVHTDGSPFPGVEHPAMITLKTGEPKKNVVMGIRKPDQTYTWISVNSEPIYHNGSDKPNAVVTSFTDITAKVNAENALKESEEKLGIIFDFAFSGIVLGTMDGLMIKVNNKFCEITGYSKEELNKMNFAEITHPEDLDKERALLEKLHKKEINYYTLRKRYIRKDGQIIPVEVKVTVSLDSKGDFNFFVGVIDDITERVKSEEALIESEERFNSFMSNSPVIAFFKDEEGRYLYINKPFMDRFKWHDVDWYLKTDYDLWPTSTAAKFREIDIEILKNDKDIILEEIAEYEGESTFWISHKFCFRNSKGDKFLGGVAIDITKQKKMENELQRLNNELEDKVRVRTVQLEETNKKLAVALEQEKEFRELQNRFINLISHEYRTPLTIISTSGEMLRKSIEKHDNEKIDKHLKKIKSGVSIMTRLVSDVLSLKKFETGDFELDPVPVDLNKMVEEVVGESVITDLGRHQITVKADIGVVNILTDKNLLFRALSQLINNAQKFSPENTEINVKLSRKGDNVVITVKDSGIGISKNDIPFLFEPFYKTKQTIGIKSGTGLGLQLVKLFVEALGGHIYVASTLAKGSEFTIELPLNPEFTGNV